MVHLFMDVKSQKIAKDIYANTKPNSKLGYEYPTNTFIKIT